MATKEESKHGKDSKNGEKAVTVAKTPAELQRMRLEKLMKNPVSYMIFCGDAFVFLKFQLNQIINNL